MAVTSTCRVWDIEAPYLWSLVKENGSTQYPATTGEEYAMCGKDPLFKTGAIYVRAIGMHCMV